MVPGSGHTARSRAQPAGKRTGGGLSAGTRGHYGAGMSLTGRGRLLARGTGERGKRRGRGSSKKEKGEEKVKKAWGVQKGRDTGVRGIFTDGP